MRREKELRRREPRFVVRAHGKLFEVKRYDYYAVVISAFAAAMNYLTVSERWEEAFTLSYVLSCMGLAEMLRALIRDGE